MPAAEMKKFADTLRAHFKEIIWSLVLYMLRKKYLLDIQVKVSGRMFQISLEFRRKSRAGSIKLGYQHMYNITKRVNMFVEKKSQFFD